MTGKKKDIMMIVSYIPLLWGDGGEKIDLSVEENVHNLAAKLEETDKDCGQPLACLWAGNKDGSLSPVLVLENGSLVAQHLEGWAEDDPGEWFELCILDKGDVYFVCLWPNLIKSKDRHICNCMIRYEEIIIEDNYDFHFLFRPIYFMSQNRGMLDQARGMLKNANEATLGFIDQKGFDMENPLQSKSEPYYVGPFPLRFEHELAEEYCDNILKQEE